MPEHDPKQFIIDSLSQPPGARELEGSEAGRSLGGQNAKKNTIQFLKEYVFPRYQIHILTFEDSDGLTWSSVNFVDQDTVGCWHMGGGTCSPYEGSLRKKAMRSAPWIQLTGWGWGNLGNGWGDSFVAIGYRTDKVPDADRIRLIFKNGLILEDSFEDDLVLFSTDQKVQVPVQVEVYSRSGELLGTQRVFDYEDMETP